MMATVRIKKKTKTVCPQHLRICVYLCMLMPHGCHLVAKAWKHEQYIGNVFFFLLSR